MSAGYEMNLKMSRNDLVAILQRMDRTFVAARDAFEEDMSEHLKTVVLQALSEFDHALDSCQNATVASRKR